MWACLLASRLVGLLLACRFVGLLAVGVMSCWVAVALGSVGGPVWVVGGWASGLAGRWVCELLWMGCGKCGFG